MALLIHQYSKADHWSYSEQDVSGCDYVPRFCEPGAFWNNGIKTGGDPPRYQ
jgi:hypothetical protein